MLITLGVEDLLSESVARRLVSEYTPGAQITNVMGLQGNQFLRRQMRVFNEIARHRGPSIVFTDLDRPESCPAELVRDWTSGLQVAPKLLMRVAVMEIEAWVIADRQSFAEWLGIATNVVSRNPDDIPDPKRELVDLARRSRKRELREALVRNLPDGLFRPGPGYNAYLGSFVAQLWKPETARVNSPSLNRAIRRITEIDGNIYDR